MLASVPSTGSELVPSDEIPCFVCVHVGAGYHATEKERSYRRLMSHACRIASSVLSTKGDLVQAVTEAIAVLEVHNNAVV